MDAQAQPGAWERNAKGKPAALQHLCGVGQNHLPLPLFMWLGTDGPHQLAKRHSNHHSSNGSRIFNLEGESSAPTLSNDIRRHLSDFFPRLSKNLVSLHP